MNKSIVHYFGLCAGIALFLLGFAACGKKEPSSPTPNLAPPVAGNLAAQAEVKASSGPIELSLLLHKTQIKLGDSLWHQIKLRNVGDREIVVNDPVFHDPWQWLKNNRGRFGIYIEVRGSDGKPLPVAPHPHWARPEFPLETSGLLEIHDNETQSLVDGWKKSGLSSRQIDSKLFDLNRKRQQTAQLKTEKPQFKLQPGESVATKSWFYYSDWEKYSKRRPPNPVGDFAELEFFDLDKPGKYQIRAVYDLQLNEKRRKTYAELKLSTWDKVLAETPWISVEVLP